MSPLQINIMLHYHCEADDWIRGNQEFLSELCEHGMLEAYNSAARSYQITEKGTAFVLKVCSIPIPTETTTYTFPADEDEE